MTSADMEKQTMKASKPAMEKRRRARINDSLLQLKALVLDGLNKNNSRHSKLEKADILEMTVRYLRSVQRQQVKGSVEADPAVLTQYRTGFAECMGEVSRYLGGAINENPEVRARLIGHLAGMCTTTTMQPQQQQPIRYAVAHGQMQSPGPNPVQPLSMSTPAVTSASPGGLVAVPNPAQVPASSAHQPVTFSFPTPPLSGGGRQPQPATFMTSPVVQNKRGAGYNRTIVPQTQTNQNQQMSPVKGGISAPPTPKTDLPTLSGKQPVMIAQISSNSGQSAAQPAGDMITLILPSQSLPGGQVPTHLIPVYAQEASKGVSPPLGFVFSSANPVSTPPSAGDKNISAAFASSASSPKVASTAPSTATICQSAAWTAVPMPTAQLVTPQYNTVVAPPIAITPTMALSVPLNAKISPPRLAIQAKQPTEAMGQPIQLRGVFQNVDASGHAGDTTPMWRPW